MKTAVGLIVGCFCFTSCGKNEKGAATYNLETNRAEDMMTSAMRESTPKYLMLRVNHKTGDVAAVVSNEEPQQTEAAYGDQLLGFSQGEQQAFSRGTQVQLRPGNMKLGESPAQTYFNGDCQIVQHQNFKLGTPQCSPVYSISSDTGFKYGLSSSSSVDDHSFYRFGLKSYFGKGFDYPFTQQNQQPQLQNRFQDGPPTPTQSNNQAPAVPNQQQGMPAQQASDEMPHYKQSPMPVQGAPFQGGQQLSNNQPFASQGNGQPFSSQGNGQPFSSQGNGQPFSSQGNGQPFTSQGNGQPFASQGNGQPFASQGNGQSSASYEPPPIPANAYGGQGFSASGSSFPVNGQGSPMNGGQGYPPY